MVRAQSAAAEAAAAGAAPEPAAAAGDDGQQQQHKTLICTSITASALEPFLTEIEEAKGKGVDVLELRLDFLQDWTAGAAGGADPGPALSRLMAACAPLPFIVTCRPTWEG
jgi:3-dehydroquinate dehydratase